MNLKKTARNALLGVAIGGVLAYAGCAPRTPQRTYQSIITVNLGGTDYSIVDVDNDGKADVVTWTNGSYIFAAKGYERYPGGKMVLPLSDNARKSASSILNSASDLEFEIEKARYRR